MQEMIYALNSDQGLSAEEYNELPPPANFAKLNSTIHANQCNLRIKNLYKNMTMIYPIIKTTHNLVLLICLRG